MDRADVFVSLQGEMAKVLELDEASITEDSLLVADLDADSIDLLEMLLSLKDRFGVVINDGEVKQLLTELARFLPDVPAHSSEMTEQELAAVSRQLRVGTIIDFVMDRIHAPGGAPSP